MIVVVVVMFVAILVAGQLLMVAEPTASLRDRFT